VPYAVESLTLLAARTGVAVAQRRLGLAPRPRPPRGIGRCRPRRSRRAGGAGPATTRLPPRMTNPPHRDRPKPPELVSAQSVQAFTGSDLL